MIKGFITNLGKYNEGELVGEWIYFPIPEEELEEVLERIGINEEYEETFFTDWESDIEGVAEYFGEYPDIEHVNEIAEGLDDLTPWEKETFEAACEVWSFDEVIESCLDNYYLLDDVHTDYDLGYYWIEDSGCYDLSNLGNLANYIDYEAFGRDIRLEENGGFSSKGYIYCA